MFRSTYIPVRQGDDNHDGVYYTTKYFEGDRLRLAVKLLENPDEPVEGVKLSAGNVYFSDDRSIAWPVYEVFMANKALEVAHSTGFWFTVIHDDKGIVQLYKSIMFHERLLLINALTSHSIIVKNKAHISTIQQIADGGETYMWLQRMFLMLESIDTGTSKVLSAVRVTTPEGDQYMVTNPYTYPLHKEVSSYGTDILEEFRQLLTGKIRKTESFQITATGIRRMDMGSYPIIPRDVAKILVDTFDNIVENKSNYAAIYDNNLEDYLYWSINRRYLVRADTLECVVVQNDNIKKLLTTVADGGVNDPSSLDLIWRLACQL